MCFKARPASLRRTGLSKSGPARLTINNSNGYGGGTFVNGGAIIANAADALGWEQCPLAAAP